ncbi:MAG: sulfotransferase domain-containing protein [Pseudomonadales bacterium]|nr:sulfotransferase domain-containing protein [Pseudomonadales bacterium]
MTEKQPPHRARTMDELREKQMAAFSAKPPVEFKPYEPRPTDVIITPFGKSGTTWTQQIFHTLRTAGDMDFTDISEVVPWIETSPMLGIDLNAEQKANPRGYKSHLGYDDIPKGARYIVPVRDPRDAFYSSYKFMEGWFMEPGAIPIDEFARTAYLREQRYWKHLASWWPHRHDDNVLMMTYEYMQAHKTDVIRRIAGFADIALNDELLALTLEHSSLEFMLKYKDRFDDKLMRDLSERNANLPPGSDSAKVRAGIIGEHINLVSQEILDEMDVIWKAVIEPISGCRNYAELDQALTEGR